MSKAADEAKMRRAREGPKKETGGNSQPDREWITEMEAAGELRSVGKEDRPIDFFDDVIYQWDGLAEDVNEEFFEFFRRPGSRKCIGMAYIRDHRGGYIVDSDWSRIRRPCLRLPLKGAEVCVSHGGKIPAVKAAAERVLAHAAETVALRLVGLTGVVDEIDQAIDHKVRLAAANSVLDRAGIKGATTVEVTLPGYKSVMAELFTNEETEA